MDFGFDSDSHKKSAVTSHLEKGDNRQDSDHSPLGGDSPFHTSDKLQKSTSGSGSTDDFEHVDHDPFMSDSGFPASSAAPISGKTSGGADSGHLLDDFLSSSQKQFDSFKTDIGKEFSQVASGAKDLASDFMSTFDDKISLTRDFMAAERGGFAAPIPPQKTSPQPPAAPISPVSTQPPKAPEYIFEPDPVPLNEKAFKEDAIAAFKEEIAAAAHKEEIPAATHKEETPAGFKVETPAAASAPVEEKPAPDSFSFFDSPVKKISKEDTEKFISSEDLLGDFSDARRTPEPALQAPSKPEPVAPAAPIVPTPAIIPEPVAPAPLIPPQPKEEPKLPEPAPAPKAVPKAVEIPISAAPTKLTETAIKPAEPEPAKPAAPEPVKPAVEPPKPAAVEPQKPAKPSAPPAEAPAKKPATPMISAEEIFCRYGLDAWFKPDRLHPVVESLIYWRDVKKSGIVFGAGLVILLAISCFSVISVFAYLSLLTLAGTIAFRIYKNVLGAIQKTSEGHPFKEYLELDLTISQEKAQNVVGVVVAHLNGFISELRRLFLVDDLVDSIKFGVILWVLTYIGAWFNGMTLVILAFVALFTLPKVYENNKQSIDTYLDLVRSKILEITDKVKAAIPIGKKQETDKDK